MLKIHFLNVGKGHSAIIEFPSGRLTMVDVDDSRSFDESELDDLAKMLGTEAQVQFQAFKSIRGVVETSRLVEKTYKIEFTDPITYLQENFPGETLFRFALTHPDMDHLSGLTRLAQLVGFTNFWDTANNKSLPASSWSGSPYRKEDWETYQQLRKSTENPKCLRLQRGNSDHYWAEDNIEILSPSSDLVSLANDTEEYNHISYVLRIGHAGQHVFLGGDASIEALDDILSTVGEEGMRSAVLLAPHHGSKTHFHKEAVAAIAPELIIVSVLAGTDYAYAEYSQFGQVLSTKWWGNIAITIDDDGDISYTTEYER